MIEIIKDAELQTHMYLYTMGEVSKILNLHDQDGKPIGRNRFFKCLRYNKVIGKDNTPSQSFINMGLAVMHTTTKRWKRYTIITFTEKGIDYLQNRFNDGKYIAYVEPKEPKVKTLSIDDVC